MKINVIDIGAPDSFQPITSTRNLIECIVAGVTLGEAIKSRVQSVALSGDYFADENLCFNIRADLWPSFKLINTLLDDPSKIVQIKKNNEKIPAAWISYEEESGDLKDNYIIPDEESLILNYSWDLLNVNEDIIDLLDVDIIKGEVRNGVNIDGNVIVGEGTVLLPGVYIEGNAIIGRDCKIGPNCYIRGKTYIGDNCHVGQAVEIKNSILMNKVSVGHLSYVGDSVIGTGTNFGAGTTTANLRHDGKNHRSAIDGELIDSGRRKFGIIVGDDVHTGINTTLYPGRKIWPNVTTLPGEIVSVDKK